MGENNLLKFVSVSVNDHPKVYWDFRSIDSENYEAISSLTDMFYQGYSGVYDEIYNESLKIIRSDNYVSCFVTKQINYFTMTEEKKLFFLERGIKVFDSLSYMCLIDINTFKPIFYWNFYSKKWYIESDIPKIFISNWLGDLRQYISTKTVNCVGVFNSKVRDNYAKRYLEDLKIKILNQEGVSFFETLNVVKIDSVDLSELNNNLDENVRQDIYSEGHDEELHAKKRQQNLMFGALNELSTTLNNNNS